MKLFLLKTLLQRRARDEGFTLPMVIALGLVMLLLSITNLTISNEENLTAISQNSRSDALAIAELGIARYRELLDRNRLLAMYDERRATTAEEAAGTDTERWEEIAEVCDDDIESLLLSTLPRGPKWQTVVDSQDLDNDGNTTEELGSYSLVSYDYINDNDEDNNPATIGISDGELDLSDDAANDNTRGRLTVRGRAANNSGEVQIEVDIPIRINLDDMKNLAPALWIGDNTVSAADLGNLTIGNGNLVIRDPAVTTGTKRDGCRDFSSLASTTPRRPVISDSRDLPPIQEVISDVAAAKTAYSVTTGALNTPDPNTPATRQQLFGATSHNAYNPETNSTNCPNIKLCRYYYDLPLVAGTTGLTYTDEDLLTDGVAKTTLLLNQDLTISATDDLTTGKDVKVGSTSNVDNDSNAFEIYVMDNDADPTNGSTNNITINADAGRTVTIHGFIHAPQSTLTITGDGTVEIFGSVWVGDFDNSDGTTVTISPDMVSREPTPSDSSISGRGYKFYRTTNSRTPRPITGSPTDWKTEQIN